MHLGPARQPRFNQVLLVVMRHLVLVLLDHVLRSILRVHQMVPLGHKNLFDRNAERLGEDAVGIRDSLAAAFVLGVPYGHIGLLV